MDENDDGPPNVGPFLSIGGRPETATPCTTVLQKFAGMFIRPTAFRMQGSPPKPTTDLGLISSPAASTNSQGETVVAAAKSEFGSYDSWDTTSNSRAPKRQRREFEEKVQERLQEIQNSAEQQLEGEDDGQQSVRCPRATYPENFKSSRSRSRTVSDVSLGSHYLVPFEGPPSLPCTPRTSLGNSATATAEASPCPTGSMFSREALRFVSIATPSPANTPKSASRSCSRSAGPVTGSGGSGGGARQYPGRKQILSQHHAYASQAHAQQLATALEAASASANGGGASGETAPGRGATRALANVMEEDEQEKEKGSAEPQQRGESEDGEEAELADTFRGLDGGGAGQMAMCRDNGGSDQAQRAMATEQGDQPRMTLEVLRALGAAAGAALGRMQHTQQQPHDQEDEELLFALEM